MDVCETPENIARNIEATLKRGYTRFNEFLYSQTGTVSICGFAESLKWTYTRLEGDVMACNRAHDWLIAHGVVPKWTLFMDAAEVIADMVTPRHDVTYLVASRCHPALFEKLEGYKVVVWHCAGDEAALRLLSEAFTQEAMEPLVNGGTATVTRAMVLAVPMGYSDIHIFGADSSFRGEHTHLLKSLVPEEAIEVMVDHKHFKTTGWMCGQVEDIKILCPDLAKEGVRITFHGDGLMQHVAKTLGFDVREYHEELAAFYGPDFAASQLEKQEA
jgi:hypothetical protein